MGNSDRPANSGRKRSSGRKRLAARAGGVDDSWQDAWEEFVAAFAKHCDLGKLNQPARLKFRAAFGASVGKAIERCPAIWREPGGSYTKYAKFVVRRCAKEVGEVLDGVNGKVTVPILRSSSLALIRDIWKDNCPGAPDACVDTGAVVTPTEMTGQSCDDLIDFFQRAAAISRRRF